MTDRSQFRTRIKRSLIWATRGQLVNLAAAVHGQPTPFPAKGPGRNLEVRPDDSFIVSYPRSGNTWLRFLIANLRAQGARVDYANIESLVPDIYVSSELHLRAMPGPRVLKSHEAFDPRYRRIIYAVRHPRDVIVSQFTTLRRLRADLVGNSFDAFVDRQIAGEFDAWFGSWSANVNSWIHHDKADLDMLLVKYEDIHGDGLATAKRICAFLGLPRTAAEIEAAIAASSRRRMDELYERSGSRLEKSVGEGNAGHLRPTSAASQPVVTPEIDARVKARYGATMAALGYA